MLSCKMLSLIFNSSPALMASKCHCFAVAVVVLIFKCYRWSQIVDDTMELCCISEKSLHAYDSDRKCLIQFVILNVEEMTSFPQQHLGLIVLIHCASKKFNSL